jgi:hypothetical protein
METAALLAKFREDVRDDAVPYLWTDEEFFAYANDAQKMFCRLTGGIAATTTTNLSVGATIFALDPLVLKLRAAFGPDGRPLLLKNFEDYEFAGSSRLFAPIPGRVRELVLGVDAGTVRVLDLPEVPTTLTLVVYRMPLVDIEGEADDLEIDEQHHLHLLPWIKHRAHQKQDSETFDRGKSIEFKAEFEAYCRAAKAERERREHKPRAVTYGGL